MDTAPTEPETFLTLDEDGAPLNTPIPGADAATLTAGTVSLRFRAHSDGTLLRFGAEAGDRWELTLQRGSLVQRTVCAGKTTVLDAEDADHLTDGAAHDLVVTVAEDGTRLYLDGYQAFCTTSRLFFADVDAPPEFRLGGAGTAQVTRLEVSRSVYSPGRVMAEAVEPEHLVQFAAERLSDRDTARISALRTGSLRALFRVRGRHQAGVIMQIGAADAASDALTLRIDDGSLTCTVQAAGERLVGVGAEGTWDDGEWHDVVVTTGYGATTLYCDGYQVGRSPGAAFLADLERIDGARAGMDLAGARLFGEAQTAMIYDRVLSDAQVKRLAAVPPLHTTAVLDAGYLGAASHRIPALLTTASGVVIAAADQRTAIPNDSPNHINFVIRRSLDGGHSWQEPQTVVHSPGEGLTGACVTDPVLVQHRDSGRIFALMDHFPGTIGQLNSLPGSGFDEHGRRILTDRDGAEYRLQPDGGVTDADAAPTDYRVDPDGEITLDGQTRGNIWLTRENPALRAHPTCALWLITSDDDGATWSTPRDITPQVKEPWMRFLGAAPGTGIHLRSGPHAGRLLLPVYYNHEHGAAFSCAVVYSDDGGATWALGGSPNDDRDLDGVRVHSRDLPAGEGSLYESAIAEVDDGRVVVFARNQHRSGRVAKAFSDDGGTTWGPVSYDPDVPEIFSQPAAIAVQTDAGPGVLFANAAQMLPFRGCGVLRLSLDGAQHWAHSRVLNPRHHVYQSLTQLPSEDGRPGAIGVLWEREWHGLYFTRVPLTWLESSLNTTLPA